MTMDTGQPQSVARPPAQPVRAPSISQWVVQPDMVVTARGAARAPPHRPQRAQEDAPGAPKAHGGTGPAGPIPPGGRVGRQQNEANHRAPPGGTRPGPGGPATRQRPAVPHTGTDSGRPDAAAAARATAMRTTRPGGAALSQGHGSNKQRAAKRPRTEPVAAGKGPAVQGAGQQPAGPAAGAGAGPSAPGGGGTGARRVPASSFISDESPVPSCVRGYAAYAAGGQSSDVTLEGLESLLGPQWRRARTEDDGGGAGVPTGGMPGGDEAGSGGLDGTVRNVHGAQGGHGSSGDGDGDGPDGDSGSSSSSGGDGDGGGGDNQVSSRHSGGVVEAPTAGHGRPPASAAPAPPAPPAPACPAPAGEGQARAAASTGAARALAGGAQAAAATRPEGGGGGHRQRQAGGGGGELQPDMAVGTRDAEPRRAVKDAERLDRGQQGAAVLRERNVLRQAPASGPPSSAAAEPQQAAVPPAVSPTTPINPCTKPAAVAEGTDPTRHHQHEEQQHQQQHEQHGGGQPRRHVESLQERQQQEKGQQGVGPQGVEQQEEGQQERRQQGGGQHGGQEQEQRRHGDGQQEDGQQERRQEQGEGPGAGPQAGAPQDTFERGAAEAGGPADAGLDDVEGVPAQEASREDDNDGEQGEGDGWQENYDQGHGEGGEEDDEQEKEEAGEENDEPGEGEGGEESDEPGEGEGGEENGEPGEGEGGEDEDEEVEEDLGEEQEDGIGQHGVDEEAEQEGGDGDDVALDESSGGSGQRQVDRRRSARPGPGGGSGRGRKGQGRGAGAGGKESQQRRARAEALRRIKACAGAGANSSYGQQEEEEEEVDLEEEECSSSSGSDGRVGAQGRGQGRAACGPSGVTPLQRRGGADVAGGGDEDSGGDSDGGEAEGDEEADEGAGGGGMVPRARGVVPGGGSGVGLGPGITDDNRAMLTRQSDGKVLVERRAQRRGNGLKKPRKQRKQHLAAPTGQQRQLGLAAPGGRQRAARGGDSDPDGSGSDEDGGGGSQKSASGEEAEEQAAGEGRGLVEGDVRERREGRQAAGQGGQGPKRAGAKRRREGAGEGRAGEEVQGRRQQDGDEERPGKRKRRQSVGPVPNGDEGIPLAAGPDAASVVLTYNRVFGRGWIRLTRKCLGWFLQDKDIVPTRRSSVRQHAQLQRQGQAGGQGDGPQPPGTLPPDDPATKVEHRVKLYVCTKRDEVNEMTPFEVKLTQKPSESAMLWCHKDVKWAVGVNEGQRVQLVRHVGPGGVVQVELRLHPEEQQQMQQTQQGGAGPSAAGDDGAGAVLDRPEGAGGEGPAHDGTGAEAADPLEEQGQEQAAGPGAHAAVQAQGQHQGLERPAARGQGQGHGQRTAQRGSSARKGQRLRGPRGPGPAGGRLQGQRRGSKGSAGVPGQTTPQAARREPPVGRPLAVQAPPGGVQGGQRKGGAGGGGMEEVRSEGAGSLDAASTGAAAGMAVGGGRGTQLAQQQERVRAAQAPDGEGLPPGGGGADAPGGAQTHAAPGVRLQPSARQSEGGDGDGGRHSQAGNLGPHASRMAGGQGGAGAGGGDDQGGNGQAGPPQEAPWDDLSTWLVHSLTPANLCGYIDLDQPLPLVREEAGEWRLCGRTSHPSLVPEVRVAMDTWQEALGPGGLAAADPSVQQVYVGRLGKQVPEAQHAWAQRHQHVAEALEVCQVVVQRNELIASDTASDMARRLGWLGADWDRAWPKGRVELEGVKPCRDQGRGGLGLIATGPITKSSVIGICSGYVLPADVASTFASRGFQACSPEVKAEVAERAGGCDGLTPAWQVLAGSCMVDCGGGHVLSMLGYGNMAALVNDLWVDLCGVGGPSGQASAGGGQQQEQEQERESPGPQANCAIVPVVARGLVLPVLVALRGIRKNDRLVMERSGSEQEERLQRVWGFLRRVRGWGDGQLVKLLGHEGKKGT